MESEDKSKFQNDQALKVEKKLQRLETEVEKILDKEIVSKIMPRRNISIKILYLAVTVTLLISWLLNLAWSLNIHDQNRPCPQNAACSLFLTCYGGYDFIEQEYECRISKEAKDQAFQYLIKITQQISYEFGDLNCHTIYSKQQSHKDRKLIKPTRQTLPILQSIKKPGVKQWFIELILQEKIMEQFGYLINSKNDIVPTKMKISNFCLIKRTYENHQLQFVSICIFSGAILLYTCYRIYKCRYFKIKEKSIRIGQFILKIVVKIKNFFANTLKGLCKNFFNSMKNSIPQNGPICEKSKKLKRNYLTF